MHFDRDDLNLIRACAQPLVKLFQKREDEAIKKLCANFKAGAADSQLRSDVAVLTETRAQLSEIINALNIEERDRANEHRN